MLCEQNLLHEEDQNLQLAPWPHWSLFVIHMQHISSSDKKTCTHTTRAGSTCSTRPLTLQSALRNVNTCVNRRRVGSRWEQKRKQAGFLVPVVVDYRECRGLRDSTHQIPRMLTGRWRHWGGTRSAESHGCLKNNDQTVLQSLSVGQRWRGAVGHGQKPSKSVCDM